MVQDDAPIGGGRQTQVQQDESRAAATNWAAFRRLMRWVGLATVATTGLGLWWLQASGAPPRWELWLAAAGGIAGTMLLTGALMGLVFLSNRSGHDASGGQPDPGPQAWPDD
jgi:hypothetical protein